MVDEIETDEDIAWFNTLATELEGGTEYAGLFAHKYYRLDRVSKIKGYKYDGTVVAVFLTLAKKVRYVVDNGDGMLHIFNEDQLALRTE